MERPWIENEDGTVPDVILTGDTLVVEACWNSPYGKEGPYNDRCRDLIPKHWNGGSAWKIVRWRPLDK